MSIQPYSDADTAAEAQLQQELHSLFLLDTQTYLQRYSEVVGQLNPGTWAEDIQELYRCVHTIKGGAVTVGAEAILQTSTALEDLLSALRYLDPAPPLQDGKLGHALLEAGELLGSVPSANGDPVEITTQISPTLQRLQQLHEQVQANYLASEWDEKAQLCYEFAEQGFDLVVLNLEMALEQSPAKGIVDADLLETASATISQLQGIGEDLDLDDGWTDLLSRASTLLQSSDLSIWHVKWPRFLSELKACAKQGGQWEGNEHVLQSPSIDWNNQSLANSGSSELEDRAEPTASEASVPLAEATIVTDLPRKLAPSTPSDDINDSEQTFDSFELSEEHFLEMLDALAKSERDEDDKSVAEIESTQSAVSLDSKASDPHLENGELDKSGLAEIFTSLEKKESTDILSGQSKSIELTDREKSGIEDSEAINLLADENFHDITESHQESSDSEHQTSFENLAPPIGQEEETPLDLSGIFSALPSQEIPDSTQDIEERETLPRPSIAASEPSQAITSIESNESASPNDPFGDEELNEAAFADMLSGLDNWMEEGSSVDLASHSTSIGQVDWLAAEEEDSEVTNLLSNTSPEDIAEEHQEIIASDTQTNFGTAELPKDREEEELAPSEITSSPSGEDLAESVQDNEALETLSTQAEIEDNPAEEETVEPSISARESRLSEEPELSQAPPQEVRQDREPIAPATEKTQNIQIPVPLERLDRSARNVVDTILAMRTSKRHYNSLQEQLLPLIGLAKESVQYIAQLRQVQDDYTLLSASHTDGEADNGPSPERYRQGYITINRLLENSLRLMELGAEAEQFVHETNRGFQELDRSIQKLQSTVEESRLVPFRNLAFRARAILRDLVNRYGKPAQLIVKGEHLELDAGTIRRLEPVLLHLLRNAYDHGIESQEERNRAGKSLEATIELSLSRHGSRFSLSIRDDGRGIDSQVIAEIARSAKLPQQDVSTPEALLSVLTQPGFSTKATPTDLSGRGVGMDVVSQQVAALGGQIGLETKPNVGTTFYVQLPVPHLLVRCVVVRAGTDIFAIPSEDIAISRLHDQLSYQPAPTGGLNSMLAIDSSDKNERAMPVVDLQHYWQGNPTFKDLSSSAICLRIDRPQGTETNNHGSIWLAADDLVEQVDLLIEALPSPLMPPPGLLGVSLQADGRTISVLDVIAIREKVLDSQASLEKLAEPEQTNAVRKAEVTPQSEVNEDNASKGNSDADISSTLMRQILVVDDAALMRRRLEASLTANGYAVTTASDGLEAWNWLQANSAPSLIVTDIEMPQMDGFTLLERCRKSGINTPVLVVSSRLSEEWSKEAQRLGATDYLTKGFSTSELLQRVRQAINAVPQLS